MSRRGVVAGVTMTIAGVGLGRAGVVLPATDQFASDLALPAAQLPNEPRSAAPPVAASPAVPQVTAPPVVAIQQPRWMRYAVSPPKPNGRPVIAIVIDDMGVMHANTNRAIALPAGPLTFAWFPFAPRLPEQIEGATARGHETLLHMPMQAISGGIYQTGPDPLRIDLPPAENLARLQAAIEAIPNAVGLNNHMGSVATRDPALMELVARETRSRDMLFLDSLTVSHSVALAQARAEQVPSSARDVFIDNSPKPAMIREQLDIIEREATKNGRVIAIGHPRPNTLEALEWWLPTLEAKGFLLWPLAATVAYQNNLPIPGDVAI